MLDVSCNSTTDLLANTVDNKSIASLDGNYIADLLANRGK